MLSNSAYTRTQLTELLQRLREPRRFIQIVTGSRQVGKTTLLTQAVRCAQMPCHFASADEPTLRGPDWIAQQWEAGRLMVDDTNARGALLIIDEVQKVPGWTETVKRLWDEDTRSGRQLRVVLSGSAPLFPGRGITESLAGRFELVHLPHWAFPEMREAFGWSLEQFLFFGGYPGAAPLVGQPARWTRYVRDSLIETTVARDVLLLTRVDKPVLLRRLFELGCSCSGQILSYNKMVGQLQDAGNTTTLAHYLDLLAAAGMLTGLHKYAGDAARRRGSSPKLQVFNTALMTTRFGLTLAKARKDGNLWGRLVESAVGAHLINASIGGLCEVFYWRDRSQEVDFVVRAGDFVTAIEVKSGRIRRTPAGMNAFVRTFAPSRVLLLGGGGISIEEFLSRPVEHWAVR